jgi:hypothetical protein
VQEVITAHQEEKQARQVRGVYDGMNSPLATATAATSGATSR